LEGVFTILKLPDLLGHLVAFLLLFWILKKFAWGPVLQMVDQRRESIEKAYAEVETKQAQVDRLQSELDERLSAIEEERRRIMEEAAREGRALADEIRQAAEQQRERILAKAQADIQMEREKLKAELNNYVADLAIDISEKLVAKQLDREEQRRLIKTLTTGL